MVPSNATPWQSTWRGIFLVGNSFAKMDPQMWVNVLKGTCYTLYIYSIYIFFYCTIIVLIGGTNNIQCIVKYSGYNYISSCWFQTFFIFPYIWNSNPNWLSYFSEGLKPPTRYIYIYIVHILYKHVPLVGYPHPVVQAPMGTAFDLKLPPLGATWARGF